MTTADRKRQLPQETREKMAVVEWEDDYEVHNRNLIRSEEHLSISVDNDRSNLDSFNESQNPKIDSSDSKSTTNSDRIYSGLRDDPRLQQRGKSPAAAAAAAAGNGRGGPGVGSEQKNEILSRTARSLGIKLLFKNLFFYILLLFLLNAHLGAESASLKPRGSFQTGLAPRRSQLGGRGGEYPQWKRQPLQRQRNKNCKEYDITSRAFTADLIFEGKARSKRELGQYITFGVQKILKLKKTGLKPRTQIRLHFGKRSSSNHTRNGYLSECLSRSLPAAAAAAGEVDLRWKLKFGTNYFVFADLSGPMNYTAKGDPVVANRRNLKSIRSAIATDREKPPRVRGLHDQNLKTKGELRLTCRIKGTPVPRINWYKDGHPLIPSPHVNVTYYRKNSTVEIRSLERKDAGRYECKATSATGKTANMSAYVNVSEYYPESTTDPDWPFRTVKCQVDSYCLNEGKCEFIEGLGEHMCRCKTGYVGARCENKQLSTIDPSSYVCGFHVGYSSYYC